MRDLLPSSLAIFGYLWLSLVIFSDLEKSLEVFESVGVAFKHILENLGDIQKVVRNLQKTATNVVLYHEYFV